MAPILSFTAEEAWAIFAGQEAYAASDETIFTQTGHVLPLVADAEKLVPKFELIRACRAEVMKQLEEVRGSGQIGSGLQAEVLVRASGEKYAAMASLGDELKFVFITSEARVEQVASEAEEAIVVQASSQTKCERCWHYKADVGSHAEHAGLCGRCFSNLFGSGEVRKFA